MAALRLGTRGSRLALVQARSVARALADADPALDVDIVEVATSGDRIRDVPLGPELGQAFFTKEIEDALLDGRIDVAVHSCKDLATRLPAGLALGAVPSRADPRDALVSRVGPLADLPARATIGTASVRRRRFLELARPDLDVRDLRGNVPTRVAAVDEGRLDAIVLAAAGLARLDLGGRVTETLDPDVMLPAASQGALALQIRTDDPRVARAVSALDDPASRAEVTAERACLRRLDAGCQAPVGALATASRAGGLRLRAAVAGPDGIARADAAGEWDDAEATGSEVAELLLEALGIASLRDARWAGPAPRRSPHPA